MIPISLRHKGTVPFPSQEIAVDFEALGKLVGVQGPNGSGKTTFLELVVGALYLVFPFRPKALTRQFVVQGYITFVWEFNGQRYLSEVRVDPDAETEATLYPVAAGSRTKSGPAIAGPKQRDYKRTVEEILGPLALFLCTAYSVQQSETSKTRATSFIRADRAERRAVMASMLGLDRYALKEAAAKDRVGAQEKALAANQARIVDLEPKAHDLDAAEAETPAFLQRQEAAVMRLGEITAGLSALRERLAGKLTARAELDPLVDQLRAIDAEIRTISQRITDATTRRQNNVKILEQEQEILAAVTRRTVLATEIQTLRARQDALKQVRADSDQVTAELAQVRQELGTLDVRLAGIQATLDMAAQIREAVATSRSLTTQLGDVDRRLDGAQTDYRAAVKKHREAVQARTAATTLITMKEKDRQGLQENIQTVATVPCAGEGQYAGCRFLTKAQAAQRGLPVLDEELTALRNQVPGVPAEPVDDSTGLITDRDALKEKLKALESYTARLAALESAEERKQDLTAGKTRLLGQIGTLEGRQDMLRTQIEAGRHDEGALSTLESEHVALEATANLEPRLGAARGRIEELDGQLQIAEADRAGKISERDQLTVRVALIPDLDVAIGEIQRQIQDAERFQGSAQNELTVLEREAGQLEARIAAAQEAQAALDTATLATAPIMEALTDYTMLVKAFSPTGIPALLIDLALPEISTLASTLFRECLGDSLFTIQLVSQKESADGEKMLETLDILVTRDGKTVDAADLSGGEAVLVSEALSLALALVNAARSGKKIQTLLRDEVGAMLDPSRGVAYARMLRQAMKLGDFDRILFISHDPEVLALADSHITVGGRWEFEAGCRVWKSLPGTIHAV